MSYCGRIVAVVGAGCVLLGLGAGCNAPRAGGGGCDGLVFTAPTPADRQVVIEDYPIWWNDSLRVKKEGHCQDRTSNFAQGQVSRTGEIDVFDLGPIPVKGLTMEAAAALIETKLNERQPDCQWEVTVSGTLLKSKFAIYGPLTDDIDMTQWGAPKEVWRPDVTVTEALRYYGGLRPEYQEIQVHRPTDDPGRLRVIVIPADDLRRGVPRADVYIRGGDVIRIVSD